MFDCKEFPEENDELNHQVEVELQECWKSKISDSEYQEGVAMLTREEVARKIELNRQIGEIESSPLLG